MKTLDFLFLSLCPYNGAVATIPEIEQFLKRGEAFIKARPTMDDNNKNGRVFTSALDELNELTTAFAEAGWDPVHAENFQLYEHPEILEEFPDPILYILQIFHGTDIPIAYYLQDLLSTTVGPKDADILIAQAKEDAIDPDAAKFSELTRAYRVLGSVILFCLAHGVDPIRVSELKMAFNEHRFPEQQFAADTDIKVEYPRCKERETRLGYKPALYSFLVPSFIALTAHSQQITGQPRVPAPMLLRQHMQSLELAAQAAA